MNVSLSRLKVCQLCAVDFTLKRFLLPLIDAMKDEGWEVHSACSYGKDTNELLARGYIVHNIKIARSINPISAILAGFQLVRLFRAEKFDVVHVHTPVAALIGRFAAKIAKVPFVIYTAHGFYFHDQMPQWKQNIFIWLERIAGRHTDLLFTQSEEDAQTAILKKIMPRESTLAIGNGVNSIQFNPDSLTKKSAIRLLFNIPEEAFVVGLIGRQVKEKGICELLQSAINLAKINSTIYFLVVGEKLSSDHADGVTEEISLAKQKLGHRLVITGSRDDIPEMLQAMDVFCLPSWREGMPRTIIEAMMMAKPVIATNIRGSREEVLPGITGLLIPVCSTRDLTDAILFFASNPDKCISYGMAGRERALALYEEDHVVALQIDALKTILSKKIQLN